MKKQLTLDSHNKSSSINFVSSDINESVLNLLFSDINECEEVPSLCGAGSTCTNTDGSYTCTCVEGFQMVNGSCIGECIMHNKQNLTAKLAPEFRKFDFIWIAVKKIFSHYLCLCLC